jgi:TolB-like protein/DNA-binding winged helix-turn-helix (wHTH) protein/tetratricopeptide (TPR) repeat protein
MSPSSPEVLEQPPSAGERFRLGDWLVSPASGEIAQGERVLRVEPKAMDVLVYLADREGQVVSREELERDVWRGALVGYDAVTGTVIKLRKALDDDAREPRYIATVPKRGYRMLPGVVRSSGPQSDAKPRSRLTTARSLAPRPLWRHAFSIGLPLLLVVLLALALLRREGSEPKAYGLVPRVAGIPSLVVLPFSNLVANSDEQYFINGLTEDVITGLSKLSGLRVIARNSAFAFAGTDTDPREAAEQLGVRYVLQGSVQRSGDRLRVTAKLVDTETGAHLWAEQYDGGVGDLFAFQDRVAEQTASALSVTLTEDERRGLAARPTTSLAAYEDYLRGRMFYGSLTKEENDLARAMYRRATQKDPNFALAYAGLALSYIDDARSGWDQDDGVSADQAIKMAERAVALDETLPQAHFALGFVYLYGQARHDDAIAEARRALELDPNYADAYALLSSAYLFVGELDKTIELDQEAMRINPASSVIYHIHLGRRHYLLGHYQEALDNFLISAAKNYNYLPTHVWLAATYARLGDLEEAQWSADQVRILDPAFSIEDWMRRRPYKNPEHRALLIEGLKAAGLD